MYFGILVGGIISIGLSFNQTAKQYGMLLIIFNSDNTKLLIFSAVIAIEILILSDTIIETCRLVLKNRMGRNLVKVKQILIRLSVCFNPVVAQQAVRLASASPLFALWSCGLRFHYYQWLPHRAQVTGKLSTAHTQILMPLKDRMNSYVFITCQERI